MKNIGVMSRCFAVVAVGFCVACSPSAPQPDPASPVDGSAGDKPPILAYYEIAMGAGNRGEWTAARDSLHAAIEIAPDAPVLLIHAARAAAHLGEEETCRRHLERVARLGATADLGADDAFTGLVDRPWFRDLEQKIQANGEPHPAAEIFHRFADADLWPEGIAYDEETGNVYVGSIHRRTVNRITPDGRFEVLDVSSEDEIMEVIGIWVDVSRRKLWAVTGEGEWRGPAEGSPRKNELVRFDLVAGELDGRWPIPDDELRMLNDVVVGPDGTAWVTESLRGEIFRVGPGGELELFSRFPELVFLNGVAINGGGDRLFLGHFAGLSVVSTEDRTIRSVRGRDMALGMVDGLSWADDRLVLVQNSQRVNFRVVRVDLGGDGMTAERLEVLPSGLPEGLIPYTSAIAGEDVFVVAAAPFDLLDRGEVPPAPAVVRFPLDP